MRRLARRLRLEPLESRDQPATLVVNSLGDTVAADGVLTFREAINAVNAGNSTGLDSGALAQISGTFGVNDTIQFGLAGTVLVGGNDTTNPFAFGPTAYVVVKNVVVTGNASGTTLDGQDLRRLFGVMAGKSLTLDTLTLTGGKAQGGDGGIGSSGGGGGGAGLGGAIFNNGSITLTSVILVDNLAQGGNGGGVSNENTASGGGGGSVGGPGGIGTSNLGGGGGGVGGGGGNSDGSSGGSGGVGDSGSPAGPSGNGASGGGGGGSSGPSSGPAGNGSASSSGGLGGGGGGGAAGSGGQAGGSGGFGGGGGGGPFGGGGGTGGYGGGGGGGLGTAGFGGGNGGNSTSASRNGGGGGAGLGGAIFNNAGTLTITNSTFANNSTAGGSASSNGVAGSGLGGAIFNLNGTVSVDFSTFSGNTAAQGGQAIFSLSHESANGITPAKGVVNLANSIFAETNALAAEKRGGDAAATNINFGAPNLIPSTPVVTGGATISGTTPTVANPLLSVLGSYGGPTQTFALLPGSPAIDTASGTAPATDQRGISRTAPDIGAFESRGFTITITGGNNQSATVATGFANPLQVSVTATVAAEPVNGGQVTFTAPGSGASATLTGSPAAIASGAAAVTAAANTKVGGFQVSAGTAGATTVTFDLTNTPGAPAGASFTTEPPSSVTAGGTFGVAVTVVDAFNNPVPTQSVTLSLNGTGTLSGTTTINTNSSGVATFTGLSVDLGGTKTLTATVGSATGTSGSFDVTLVVTPGTLPAATAGVAYTQALTATGANGAPSFAITSGALPPGLTLTTTGTLSGTPTAAGSFPFDVTATDTTGGTGTRSYTLTSGSATVVVDSLTVPPATATIPYSATLTASGGTAPYFFTVTSGSLPPGLALAVNGTVSGIPTMVGVFAFTVTATDSSTGSGPFAGSQPYTLSVAKAPQVITFPTPPSIGFASGVSVTLAATASSGLPVSYEVVSGPGVLVGNTLFASAPGTVLVRAAQVGDDSFLAATPAEASVIFRPVGSSAFPEFTLSGTDTGVTVQQPDGTGTPALGTGPGSRAVVADVTGDGVPDTIVATGPGDRVTVTVTDGATGRVVRTLGAFEDAFRDSAVLAAGDVNGDGIADIAVGADAFGGPRVTVFDGATGAVLADFYGIDDPDFRGGVRVALGDVNGDGLADLAVAAGVGGGPRIAVWDGKSLRPGVTPRRLVDDFFCFEPTLRDGANVALGDVNGDGKADLILSGGPGGGPRVLVWDAADFLATNGGARTVLANFFAGDPTLSGGARVAAKNLDGDSLADLVVGIPTGPKTSVVRTYLGKDLTPAGTPPAFDETPLDAGGVFVG